jgi:beta-lactamase class A
MSEREPGSSQRLSRRAFIGTAGAGAAAGAVPLAVPALAGAEPVKDRRPVSSKTIIKLFSKLPGTVAIKIVAPPAAGDRGLLIESNASQQMFVGSAIKTFALCEALRQVDSPDILTRIGENPTHPGRVVQLALNESVWNVDSQSFNPPHLKGRVSERTALEAMICHSDNTATDMIFKHVGVGNIRKLIASLGLRHTEVPDSTRIFFGYILGAKNYRRYSWKDLTHSDGVYKRPPLNDVQTLASSADDLVSYYSRALRGRLFKHLQTLSVFREILAMGDAIWLLPVPLGVSAFVKGGSIDTPGFHAVCAPGGMLFDGRWVFFSLTINWNARGNSDPRTVASFLAAGSRALALVKDSLSAR